MSAAVQFWGVANGKELDTPVPPWFGPDVMAYGPERKTMAVAVPPFGKTIEFRDVATGQVRGAFRGPPDRVTALAFGPDGRLFTGTPDGTVLVWDPRAVQLPPADRK